MNRHSAGRASGAFALLLLASNAWAEGPPSKKGCINASLQAQELRAAGKWAAAKDALATCSDTACPGLIRRDCTQWMSELTAATPTVVFGAVDGEGKDLTDFRVSIDGTDVTPSIATGQALSIDPGSHVVRYERAGATGGTGATVVERSFIIREGEKARPLVATFSGGATVGGVIPGTSATPTAAPPPVTDTPAKPSSSSNTTVGIVLSSVAAAALASGIYFAYENASHTTFLQNECAHNGCPAGSEAYNRLSDQVTTVNAERALAGVSFGVSGAALGVAIYFFVAHPLKQPSPAVTALSGVRAGAMPGGATVGYGATF